MSIALRVQVRRFFCSNPKCVRRIFAERIEKLARSYAQRTCRLKKAQTAIAQAVGSRPGVRLCSTLQMLASASSLLRLERAASLPERKTPRVLGVDDFAFRRGHRYGTLLYDLEAHVVVDLLPDRTAETLSLWLREHPGIDIVSRDRATAYAEAVRTTLPQALQVADRWHLVKNLGQALEIMLDTKRPLLREAAKNTFTVSQPSVLPELSREEVSKKVPRAVALKECHRQERLDLYLQIHALYRQGMKLASICRHMHLDPKTARKYLRSSTFVDRKERAPQKRGKILDPFAPFLRQRWEEGCHSVTHLLAELREQGYRGCYTVVKDFVREWRLPDLPRTNKRADRVSPRQVAMWLLRREEERTDTQNRLITHLQMLCEPFRVATELADRFLKLVRQSPRTDQKEAFHVWLSDTLDCSVTELRTYAAGLKWDQSAVEAGLSLPWSNGAVEGSVHRLKFIKRRGYGRANFDLLRRRVLQPI